MALFSRQPRPARLHGWDSHDRQYVLTGSPVVSSDDWVLLVDLTVDLDVRPDWEWGYDATDEKAIHAVAVTTLRLLAEQVPAEELLVSRQRIVQAVEKALAFAPVGAGLDLRVSAVEVSRNDAGAPRTAHEFRVVSR
jgi:hypothetical protein